MKKIFGELNINLKTIIISAILIGISVGLLNSIPNLYDTTITDIATYFDFWILCGILIISNSKSKKDSALKCFLFFLISQPLIYLSEAPFNKMGLKLFIYYKPWFIWTLLCIPMGYFGYNIKKDKWYSILILLPILILLGYGLSTTIINIKYSFPKHIINTIFVFTSILLYPQILFNNKKNKIIGLILSIIIILLFGTKPLLEPSVYNTTLKCSSETFYFDNTYTVYLQDKKYGDVEINYNKQINSYCINASFKKPGKTKLIIKTPNDQITKYNITIGKMTYDLENK
jgi:hypothetical protein